MNHFYVWRINKLKLGFSIIILALIVATIFWIGQKEALFVSSTKETTALIKGNEKEPNIALTFNISWGEERVHDILKQLAANDVQATFFISGEWAERHPDIVEKISKEKHEIGMLGYRYKSYLEQELDQVRKDLLYAKEIFGKLGLKEIDLLRTPNGHFNEEIIELAENIGFKVVHWNINPNDWRNPGTNYIVDHVMKRTTNGDILLLHASDSAKQTADALKTVMPGLKNKGFQFITISEMINQAHAKSKLID